MVTILNYNGKQLADWREGRKSVDDLDSGTQTVIAQLRTLLGLPEDWLPPNAIKPAEVEPELEATTDLRESLARQL